MRKSKKPVGQTVRVAPNSRDAQLDYFISVEEAVKLILEGKLVKDLTNSTPTEAVYSPAKKS